MPSGSVILEGPSYQMNYHWLVMQKIKYHPKARVYSLPSKENFMASFSLITEPCLTAKVFHFLAASICVFCRAVFPHFIGHYKFISLCITDGIKEHITPCVMPPAFSMLSSEIISDKHKISTTLHPSLSD